MRSGFVALAGRPNVGKSTLVNALCGEKVAIVSDKPQTTRHRVQGVANGPDSQLVLVDLPGFQRPRDALTERMQRRVERGLVDVDALLFVLAADERIGPGDRFVAERAFSGAVPVVIALNKVDRVDPARIAAQIAQAAELGEFHALHPVSAKTGDGVSALRDELTALLPEDPLYFPRGRAHRRAARAADRRARPREGARADPGGAAARDHGGDRRDRGRPRQRDDPRRDVVPEADRRGQGRLDGQGDRHSRAARDRASARTVRSTSTCG